MAANIEQHAQGLLEWLYRVSEGSEPESADISPYLTKHGLDLGFGYQLVRYLAERGLVQDVQKLAGPDAQIRPDGIAVVQRIHAQRADPTERSAILRRRMLTWLDEHDERNKPVLNWESFLASDQVLYHGNAFSRRDVTRAAVNLSHNKLISFIAIEEAADGMVNPQLTVQGQTCITDFGGSVAEYLNRGNHTGDSITNTTIHMSDNHGNMTVASENVRQTVTSGLDVTKVLEFAGLFRQISSTLQLPAEERQALDANADELHAEALAESPDRGRMRQLLDRIMQGFNSAAPTAAKSVLLSLATEATNAVIP